MTSDETNNSFKMNMNIKLDTIVMVAIFGFVLFGILTQNSEPTKYLTSPLTILTVLVLFLMLTGILRVELWTLALVIVLLLLTAYQSHIEQFFSELRWDMAHLDNLWTTITHSGPHNPEIREKIIAKFHQKYAVKYSDTNYYFYIKQVDSELSGRISLEDRILHNYYVVILPEILSVTDGLPLDTTTDTRLTMYAIKHQAAVPIVYDSKVYTVIARAYLIELPPIGGASNIESEATHNSLWDTIIGTFEHAFIPFATLLEGNVGNINTRAHGTYNYSDFVAWLQKHEYNIPDSFYLEA